jgi:septation ring formation regulator EzrA
MILEFKSLIIIIVLTFFCFVFFLRGQYYQKKVKTLEEEIKKEIRKWAITK